MSISPRAAVAIIRVSSPRDSILLLRRNTHPSDPWSGHYSFPGGRKDEEDSGLLDTCLRETREETGIVLLEDQVTSALPEAYAGSRVKQHLLVKPYLFELAERPNLDIDKSEIRGSCWLNVERFLEMDKHVEAEVMPDFYYPAYPLYDYYLWGFTYNLLIRLFDLETSSLSINS